MRNLLFCVCLVFLTSCSSNIVYEKTFDFENGVWSYNNPSSFELTLDNNNIKYDLLLDINHSISYPFENLYLKIKTEFPDQSSVSDTLSIEMVNKQGAWVGNCSGENCQLRIVLQERTRFKDAGDHSITFEQFTREEDLQGVNSLGFSLLSSKQ